MVQVEPRPLRQPGLEFGEFVGAEILENQMQIELLARLFVDTSQEAQELLVTMPETAVGDHCTGVHIRSRLQSGGAMAE